ncbi:MAG: flagellar biosynthesis protein FlgL [Sulfurimonas sp.]|nr:flagellar biosynthesis protein FlgL [Sulfurimonas sp.]MBU3937910.1 flagellar biosynthesis protein FlgL [bacterium]MBU4025321.1 flagellar biosynthesis protein FlgL [bacterium]MBU4059337.1 flagellar biosynthesis protein FlgL [bacterium]MBU4111176.1 flagellar biosynthesis protein FlgL [bacterium]
MRVTSSMYYENLFGSNNTKLNSKLFDVNKQIASGLKIQYANEDVATFAQTMQLDNEMTTLGQIKKSVDSGYKVSNQTDVVLNDFGTSLDRVKALLVSSASAAHSTTSLGAIASELRGLEKHLKNLANTSINGQFLFSGSAVDTKPIGDDGIYNGNDGSLKAFLGSQAQQQYNLSGAELFLGEDVSVKREVTSNVQNFNLSAKYPDFTDVSVLGADAYMTSENSIRDLMGDIDNSTTPANDYYFYLRGTKSDGSTFNLAIPPMSDNQKVDELLNTIGEAYGNTANLKLVNVSMNDRGEIVVQDKMKGSSKLDFHLVGAVDFSGAGAANVVNIDSLDIGETNFVEIINPTGVPNGLYVKEFVKSSFTPANGAASNIEGLLYDRTEFAKNGSKLSSNVSQVLKDGNAFATSSTKISEVADLSQGNAGTLDGTQFKLVGTTITGAAFDVQIDFKNTANGGSTFSLDGGTTNLSIFDMSSPVRLPVNADDMTYQQLMDVVNMAVSGNVPSVNTSSAYDASIASSIFSAQTTLSYDGKIQFSDATSSNTKAAIALFDSNSGTFGGDSSVMGFNANNALTIRDPKTDFFKAIDEIIRAVEGQKEYPDGTKGDARNVGIQNAIAMIDDLQDHVTRSHTKVGAQSNALSNALDRTSVLEINTMTLRSSVIDTDFAEASLQLAQLSLNYEAMLSTVGKVSKLSLVNYL